MTRATHPIAVVALALLAALAPRAAAHEGPPFPVLVDEVEPPWSISIWADPDVGLGTFWVRLVPAEGHTLPDDSEVRLHVAPADGRLAETTWRGDPEAWRDGEQHVVEVQFPTREFWLVRLEVGSASTGARAEEILRVEVTPPGYGPVDIVLYGWPFVVLGGLWVMALLKRRGARRAS